MTDMVIAGYFIQRARGDYEYSTLGQYLQDLSPDVLGERSTGTPPAPFGFIESAGFFNDDFRVSHNLTLNLGLRYEYVTVPVGSRYQANDAIASVPGVVTFADPEGGQERLVAAPRVCVFAWKRRRMVHPRRREPCVLQHLHQP